MKPTIGDIIGGVCIVALPFLLIFLLHGMGVGQ
jgi:hypothetical protein